MISYVEKPPKLSTSYPRAPGVRPCSFSLDREAYEEAKRLAPSVKQLGSYLSRLVFEDRARREERARFRAEEQATQEG